MIMRVGEACAEPRRSVAVRREQLPVGVIPVVVRGLALVGNFPPLYWLERLPHFFLLR